MKIFGSLSDVNRFYHSDVFDSVEQSTAELKLIISPIDKSPEFLSDIDSKKIHTISSDSNNKCFIVNDKKMFSFLCEMQIIQQDRHLLGGQTLKLLWT